MPPFAITICSPRLGFDEHKTLAPGGCAEPAPHKKIDSELGWQPQEIFESGLAKTVRCYLANAERVREVTSGRVPAPGGEELPVARGRRLTDRTGMD